MSDDDTATVQCTCGQSVCTNVLYLARMPDGTVMVNLYRGNVGRALLYFDRAAAEALAMELRRLTEPRPEQKED